MFVYQKAETDKVLKMKRMNEDLDDRPTDRLERAMILEKGQTRKKRETRL